MNRKWIAIIMPVLVCLCLSAFGDESLFKTPEDKVSYAMGLQMGMSFREQGLAVSTAMLVRGLEDGMSGATPMLTEKELTTILTTFMAQLRQKQVDAMKMYAEENRLAGEAFLAENKTKEGVVVLPSGLQYKVITMGTGTKPTAADTVECSYRGWLVDGAEFDSSSRHEGPSVFQVSGVIPGWKEALQLMPVGSKWQLFVPPDLAYGAYGFPPQIGPNTTLIFEIELVAIK